MLARLSDPGDDVAWRDFEARYRALILSYARRIGLTLWDAEDVMQNVLLRLSCALPDFRYDPGRGRFRGWLGTVVRNAAIEHLSQRCPRAVEPEAMERHPTTGDPMLLEWEAEWAEHHYRQALQTIRKGLDPRSVAIFERLLAGDSVPGVAAAFGTSTQAVHKVKQRMRHRLKARILLQLAEEEEGLRPA